MWRYKIISIEPKTKRAKRYGVHILRLHICRKAAYPQMEIEVDIGEMLLYRGILLEELPYDRRITVRLISADIAYLRAEADLEIPETKIAVVTDLVVGDDERHMYR